MLKKMTSIIGIAAALALSSVASANTATSQNSCTQDAQQASLSKKAKSEQTAFEQLLQPRQNNCDANSDVDSEFEQNTLLSKKLPQTLLAAQ